jgi:ATP phosphoribosyltransferase
MKRLDTQRLRIAIQKEGRLSEWSVDLLRQMGLQFDTYKRLLIAPCRNHAVDILFLRDDDIPEYVQDGVVDLGIVGDNLVQETGAKVDRIRPLGFGICSLQIAAPEGGAIRSTEDLQSLRVATTSPKIITA